MTCSVTSNIWGSKGHGLNHLDMMVSFCFSFLPLVPPDVSSLPHQRIRAMGVDCLGYQNFCAKMSSRKMSPKLFDLDMPRIVSISNINHQLTKNDRKLSGQVNLRSSISQRLTRAFPQCWLLQFPWRGPVVFFRVQKTS